MERNTSDESNRCEARNEIKQEQENTRYNGQFKVDVYMYTVQIVIVSESFYVLNENLHTMHIQCNQRRIYGRV